ncbi:32596_t:CDS:2 [Gigaspora margarita]|uniref:32596_t:CDS:1 n=1 Tax=Gigaspora margarita TaxID=4874 RepID=A0ABN7VVF5_GIGMA|nr:32596_t:CDS:2 [Gigaspora margarita]
MEISKRFFCPGWKTVDIDSIHQSANTDEYLVPSTNKESELIYTVNSTIGTCNCFIGMSGASCKHQGAIAIKYHIRIINFLPSLTPNDYMAFLYIASENQKANFVNLFFNNFLAESMETGFDSSSFNNFLKEIEDDYKNCGSQLQTAFDKFAKRYIAAKSQSIGQVTTFLYDHNLNSLARIKSRAVIRVQPESVK